MSFNNFQQNRNPINQYGYFNPSSSTSMNMNMNTSTNNIIWVQGIEGAKAWQLNPNSMVILLDSEVEGKMYIKVSDNIGMCTLRVFNYVEEIPSTNATVNKDLDLSDYVRKDELSTLLKEIISNEQSVSTATADSAPTNATTESANSKQPKIIYTPKKS